MLYGLDACPMNVSQINSLLFAVTGMPMKLFCTKDENMIDYLCHYLVLTLSVILCIYIFLSKYSNADNNSIGTPFRGIVTAELTAISLKLN
jgi:hypothetical protein